MADYDEQVAEEIPGQIYVVAVIDGEENEHMPDVVSHVDEYEVPSHFVRERKVAGGTCTYAFLKALESMKSDSGSRKKKLTWNEALEVMHSEIEDEDSRQCLPTLSTSAAINVYEDRLRLVSTSKRGTKRALLIGAHYDDEEDENTWLASCHTDVRRMRSHLIHEEGFEKSNILVMLDDDQHCCMPTKNLILDSLERLCKISEPGDSIFLLFSGHGGTLCNPDEYEEDELMHELLAPADFRDNGVLLDEELYASFVTRVPEGVHAVAVIDTCHPPSSRSGKASAIDLPYMFSVGDEELRYAEGFRPGRMAIAGVVGAGVAAGATAAVSKSQKKKKKKHDDYDEEPEEPSGYDDGSYGEEKPKQKKKSKNKKKKSGADEEDENEARDNSYTENDEVEEEPKSPKKKKKKKKKKDESEEGEGSKSPKKKTKKKKKKKEPEEPEEIVLGGLDI